MTQAEKDTDALLDALQVEIRIGTDSVMRGTEGHGLPVRTVVMTGIMMGIKIHADYIRGVKQ